MPEQSQKSKTEGKKALDVLKGEFEDIDRKVVDGEAILEDKIDVDTQERVARQVNDEYDSSWRHSLQKRTTNLARLRLYNNQRRAKNTVGDPLMFTVFNTLFASLYTDRLISIWEGRDEIGDEDIEDNLDALSRFDYDVMEKDMTDYFWIWDAMFFGRGLNLLMEFDRTKGVMAPIPEIIDPMGFVHDSTASSVNGVGRTRRGAMKFGGWEVGATYDSLKASPGYFNIDALRKEREIDSLIDRGRDARDQASGRDRFYPDEEALGKYENYEFRLTNWFTTINGQQYLLTLGNVRSTLVRMIKIDYNSNWPLIDRPLFPMSGDWDGVSIPDITEDKQRARAKLLNLGVKSAVIDTLPQYIYDKSRIKNKNELNWQSNKFIGSDGPVNNAIAPVQKSVVHQYVNVIMDMLDQSVQRAIAVPEIQQGVPQDDKRTLGELNLISSNVDTRFGMNARIFGWSEKRFWRQWYSMYKKFFKDKIDEKIVRIQGPLAAIFRPLTRSNIIADVDPDVRVESTFVSEAKRVREQRSFDQFAAVVVQDPNTNRRFVHKKMGKLRGMTKEEIEMLFPPTVDEEQAHSENELLNAGEMPEIDPRDEHQAHNEIHAKANQNPQARAHMKLHDQLALEVRNNPELFPQEQAQEFQPPQGLQVGQANAPVTPEPAQEQR